MKKKIFLAVAMAALIAGIFTGGCVKKSNAPQTISIDTLNLYDTSCGVNWTDTVPGVSICQTGGYWDSTYTNNTLCFGDFVLDHAGGVYPGTSYNYWGGFTFGTNGNTLCYSDPSYCTCGDCRANCNDSVGSGGWILNQWGVMAGGGIAGWSGTQVNSVAPGVPYLVAFGSEVDVWLKDSAPFKPQGVFICNHPWPYYGNIYGDGFAKPLTDSVGAHFILKIYGDDDSKSPAIDTLAWCYTLGSVSQRDYWHWVDLSILSETTTLHFELETTDVGPYGPNTALYFCMDKLTVDNLGGASAIAEKEPAIKKPKKSVEEFGDYLTAGTHAAGEAVLYDAQGQVALKANLKTGSNRFDTRKLPAGEYRMIHHHRMKHYVKK
jgi:hypothetical protein